MSTEESTTKKCAKCGLEKPNTKKYFRPSGSRWLRNTCRKCGVNQSKEYFSTRSEERRQYDKQRYNANPEKFRQNTSAWRKANPEKAAAYTAKYLPEWLKNHPEKVREYSRKATQKYFDANPERSRKIQREWRRSHPEVGRAWEKAHPETVRAKGARRRARKAQAPRNDFTPEQWRLLQAVFNHRCAYCAKRCKGHLTQDQITPLSKGGSHTLSNIIPACATCNSRKHAGPPPIPVQPLLL